MRILLLALTLLACSGCTMKPFGFAPWVIVMPGARLEVTMGSRSEDHRTVTETEAAGEDDAKRPATGFSPPDMGK